MPDAYNEKQSERGDVAALALGLAVREQAIVVPADVLAFFKSHPSRHSLSLFMLFILLFCCRLCEVWTCAHAVV